MLAGLAAILFPLGDLVGIWAEVPLGLFMFALVLYVVPKLHASQAPDDGAAGLWGSRLVLAGAAVLLVLFLFEFAWDGLAGAGPPEWTQPAFIVAALAFGLGVVLFGVASAVTATYTRAGPVLMLVGLVAALGIDMATGAFFGGEATAWRLRLGFPVFGLGLVVMGLPARGRLPQRSPTPA